MECERYVNQADMKLWLEQAQTRTASLIKIQWGSELLFGSLMRLVNALTLSSSSAITTSLCSVRV